MTAATESVRRKCGYCHIWPDPEYFECCCDDPQAWRTSLPSSRVNIVDTLIDAGATRADILDLFGTR